MKKILFAMSALALTVFAGCEKNTVLPENNDEKELLTIHTVIENQESKVSYDDETLRVDFEVNDQLYALGFDANKNYLGKTTLTAVSIEEWYNGKLYTKFQGWSVKGAATYSFYRITPGLKVAEDGTVTHEVIVQEQADGKTCNAANYLDIDSIYDRDITSSEETPHLPLYHRSFIMRFDVKSYPKELGAIKSARWIENLGQYNERSRTLVLTESPAPGEPFSLWFVARANTMNLAPGNEIALELTGTETTMRATATSVNGKSYYGGKRYHITVSATPMDQALCTWTDPVKVKTVDNVRPADCQGFILSEQMDADGYWRYVSEKDVIELPDNMFEGRKDIVEVVLPEGLEIIRNNTFTNCTSLQKVTGMDNVKEIWAEAFKGCSSWEIQFPQQPFKVRGGAFKGCKISTTEIPVIDLDIDFIYAGVFMSCKFLSRNIRLAEGSKAIGASWFRNCTGPADLTMYIPESVTLIGKSAFHDSNFIRFDGMKGVTTIEGFAFYGFKGTTFTIPASVKNLGKAIFDYSNLQELRVEVGTDCVMDANAFEEMNLNAPVKLILNEVWKNQPNGPTLVGDHYEWMSGVFSSVEYVKM